MTIFQLNAQKEDNVWLLGGNYNFNSTDSMYKACRLDFTSDSLTITFLNRDLPYYNTNTSICDSAGELLCYSNGENLYSSDYEIMENGDDFYPDDDYEGGVPYVQGYILLPVPGDNHKVMHIYGDPKAIYPPGGSPLGMYIKLRYAIADMSQNNGLGKVVQRDVIAGTDTLAFLQITAVRHGNGRDWWVLIPHYLDQRYYRYLLSPEGLQYIEKQSIAATEFGMGQACFSPDGQWYVRFNLHNLADNSASTFDLYHFDRCSGLLSDRITKTYDLEGFSGELGGAAFSPGSRYLYVTRRDSVFQYDLQAPDILTSEVGVAVYDDFTDESGLPTRFLYPLLAPDNKIYICVASYNSRYLHVIEHPDSAGLACQVRQHAVVLPVLNNNLLPNLPYYRLGRWADSPCDTLGMVSVAPAPDGSEPFRLFPNPATSEIQIDFAEPLTSDHRLEVFNLIGLLLDTQHVKAGSSTGSLSTGSLPDGLYLLRFREHGRLVGQQKFSILH